MASEQAPGAPGAPECWKRGSKTGIGSAFDSSSSLWFAVGRGVVEEIFYPTADRPRTRDLVLAAADGSDFFSCDDADAESQTTALESGVPAYRIVSSCRRGRYRTEKLVFTHPDRPVVLQHTRFTPLEASPLKLYAIFNPHLGMQARHWLGDYKGEPMLFAEGDGAAVALACSTPWLERSVSFVGSSEAWHDLKKNKKLTRTFPRADGGNGVLTGEVDVGAGEFVLAIAFGRDPYEAGYNAHSALLQEWERPLCRYVSEWRDWLKSVPPFEAANERARQVHRVSAATLRVHQAKLPRGGWVASLTIPWGGINPGEKVGGYHLVWPRDLVESVGGLFAAGISEHLPDTLEYLRATQESDGHWPQNMRLSGEVFWNGIQLDETALVVLLADSARRRDILDDEAMTRLWPMVRRAAGYIVRTGPTTPEDRWERDGGYSPFTLAAEVSALLAAAELAHRHGEPAIAAYLIETADLWNAGIERWNYRSGTRLARELGIDGYYTRQGTPGSRCQLPTSSEKKHPPADEETISPDALALVRFGLRSPNDPRIRDTVKAIDAVLKVNLPAGPGWRRHRCDQYGEYPDGRPHDAEGGVGRVWPLLAGERGHYELAAGRPHEAEHMLRLMEAAATDTGLIPEQIWDAPDIPERGLFLGRPTGSACPLAWAHAEYLKLTRSLRDGAIFDQPPNTVERYGNGFVEPRLRAWRFQQKLDSLPASFRLRIEVLAPAIVRWCLNDWSEIRELKTTDTGLGVYVADLPTEKAAPGSIVIFTFHWTQDDHWEGTDFKVAIGSRSP